MERAMAIGIVVVIGGGRGALEQPFVVGHQRCYYDYGHHTVHAFRRTKPRL